MSLPQGTVTFLFSDIEGSTRLLHQLGENYDRLLADQRRILRDAFQKWDGQEIDTQGDSFFAAFPKAYDAVAAAADIQQAITKHKWPERVEVRLRIGLHTGEPRVAEEGYVGIDVHRAARVGNLGHGGQVLLSETTVALVRDELPKGVGLLALGQHRLKDFERPEPLSQLVIEGLPSEFPVLKSPGVRPIHLPIPSTPFIGRRKELDELSALIQDPDTRLITIFGVGGMGKTRLAIAAGETQTEPSNGRDAEKKQQFPDGIFFVSLAPLDSSDRLVSTIAEEVGFRFFEGVETRKQLLDFFREKSLLLILDNFEHLLDAASLIAEIVAVAPKVKVLTTTREKLNLSCETIFPLGGLAYPTYDTNSEDDIDALPNTYSAITLFLQTARRVNPSVKLTRENLVAVKEICQQVGGIPLGIELAAGWMEVLPAEKISLKIQENLDFLTAARRDLPDRHQSLRAVFSSTWEMLDDQLQEVFSKLTVFHGGFTHEAALDVAGASLNQLRTLLNKSLIQSLGDNRLEIHELLRQYGGEKLAQDEQHKIRVRDLHSRYFASYVEQNEAHTLFGNLESLRSEIDNILIGIRWAVKREFDHEITKQMMSMNTWFEQSGRREEGRDFFLWLKDRLNPDDRDKEKAIAYGFTLANLGWFTDSDREATAYFREARDILRRYHPGYELAVADAYLARLSGDVDYQEAEELFQESFTIFESLESAWGFAYTHNSWGDKALYDNHVPDAEIHYREGLKLSFDLGNVMKAWSLSGMGFVELFQGEYQKARKYLEEAYEAFNATDNKQWAAHRMNDLGDLALALGDLDEAERRHGEALEIRRRLGTQSFTAGSLCDLGRVALEKGDLLQAEAYFNKSIGAFADLGNRLEIGWVHRFLGDLATAMNDVRKASQEYRKSLTDIYEFRYEEYCLGVLTSIAGLWMKTSTGLQRAAELVYFVQNHPRTWIINQIALKRMIDELEDKLEAEALDNAAAAASSFELWSTVEQVIAELEASDEIKHSSANLRPDPHTSS